MPQYRYAFNDSQQVIDIFDLPQNHHEITSTFTCIACGTPLIAKTKGERRERNFAHKSKLTCNQETYLHRLAKHTFYNVYKECLETNEPYSIMLTYPRICVKFATVLGRRCDLNKMYKTHDLTDYYDGIKLEQRDDSFIPDVLIYNTTVPDRKIYIEIAVTHFLSEEKKKSKNRIIEIPIEEEGHIERIRARRLTEQEASFVNFDRPSTAIPDEECECAWKKYYYLFIYKSGKCFMGEGTIREIESKRRKVGESVKYTKLVTQAQYGEPGRMFQQLVIEARQRGYPVRNCFVCRFAGQNWDSFSDDPIYCKKFKETCTSNKGAECGSFWELEELRKDSRG
jgi:hypothetical protein